jgi:hypothetical protein
MDVFRTCASILRLRQGRVGVLLIIVCWPLHWLLPGVKSVYMFFPLWLGYTLLVDALVFARTGSSLLARSGAGFLKLFAVSAPAWWLFEAINLRTLNWDYLGQDQFSIVEAVFLGTLCFSTVMPAVFETAELIRTFHWTDRFASGPQIQPTKPVCAGMLMTGLTMLALMLWWPKCFYPFVWGSVFLIVEPLNVWAGRRHCLEWVQQGDWRPLMALSLGALTCGFFWEMWNYFAYPKWIYHTPGVEFLRIFEMPLLGYIGYLFFAWELYALRNFIWPGAPALRL